MIATVYLDDLWLHPIADLTAGQAFPLNALDYNPTVAVTFALFANGQYQPVRQLGKQQIAKVVLVSLTDDQVQQLQDWQGELLCYRDPRGRRIFGMYVDLVPTPALIPDYWSASFTFTETAWTEAV